MKRNKKILKRLSAIAMAVALVATSIPFIGYVSAATDVVTDKVTITVTDENGQPVENAAVEYTVDSVANGEDYKYTTGMTNENGTVAIMDSADYVEDDFTITAVISKDGYKTDNTTIVDMLITDGQQDIKVVLQEDVEVSNKVTIKVTDSEGNPIEGAEIVYVIDSVINGDAYKGDTKTTPATGIVEVMDASEYVENDFTVSATISKDGYVTDATTILDRQITSSGECIVVELEVVPSIENVTIEAVNGLVYNGSEHDLVNVNCQSGDTVTYKVGDGQASTELPKAIDAGDYEITVTVSRDGYNDYTKIVTCTIAQADITGIVFEGKSDLKYNGSLQELVILEGILDGDVVEYKVDNQSTNSEQIPSALAVGNYIVDVVISRGNNYKPYEAQVNVSIGLGDIELGDLVVTGLESVYNGEEQQVVIVTGYDDNSVYKLLYKMEGDSEWSEEIPTLINAGSYTVYVKAVIDENYNEEDIEVIRPSVVEIPYNVYIAKTQQSLEYDNYEGTASEEKISGQTPFVDKIFDFSATAKGLNSGNITYSIEVEDTDIASIDASTGELTVYYPGEIVIIATLTGNDNFNEKTIRYTLTVTAEKTTTGQYVSFSESLLEYVFGTNNGIVSELNAIKHNSKDKGAITYYLEKDDIGLAIDINTGKVSISDYSKLGQALEDADGELTVTITAKKAKTSRYDADEASYKINISYADIPDDAIEESGTMGNDGWYTDDVTVTAKDGYIISTSYLPEGFALNVVFSTDGKQLRYVYLRDEATGGITSKVPVQIKIDKTKPNTDTMSIEYSEISLIERIGEFLGFYKPTVTVTFTVKDVMSGIDHIDWEYNVEAGSSDVNLDYLGGELEVTVDDDVATATIKVSEDTAKQLKGKISMTATDKAGNVSDVKTNDTVIVIDTIAPTVDVKYESEDSYIEYEDVRYYNGDIQVLIDINEANFYSEDVIVKVSKDGGVAYIVTPVWNDQSVDEHRGSFTLTDDGDYIVYVTYTDKSGNTMAEYASKVMTIDTKKPVIETKYDETTQKLIVSVTEHNFRNIDISAILKETGEEDVDWTAKLKTAEWKQVGDKYICELSDFADGQYILVVNYKDISGNVADACTSEKYEIDHAKPVDVKIEYSQSLLDTVLETLTFGFYNPDVTITFTAVDNGVGVDYFTWDYIHQSGSSTTNLPTYASGNRLDAAQDANDENKYTASITLTASAAEQFRGYIAVVATDNYGNASDKVTDDGRIIVVDTIAPGITVEYGEADNVVGNVSYYKDSADVVIKITESNFYAEDVVVKLSKNGGQAYEITPEWSKVSADVHYGKYNITGDGDYVLTIEYKDRSGNEMTKYTSKVITIDTVQPALKVEYTNNSVINTIKDAKNNNRNYFDKTQSAVITVTEHNFDVDDVVISIVAEDVSGAKLNSTGLYTISDWSTDETGDVHTVTITYSGDANYTFDIECVDMAKNASRDYATDYFTVDKTTPANLKIEYSQSVLDTVLETLTFGFYNAKATVTISAEDTISGINEFVYSYINANGVSKVNAELINAAIQEAGIKYSNDRKVATVTFEIPKDVLSQATQFNGNIEFTAKDRGGNTSRLSDDTRIIVDTIAPSAQISYNDPVKEENGISYYDGDINVTITITEANFYAQDVVIIMSKNGAEATAVTAKWADTNVDVHVGTFTLEEDGDYVIKVNYVDKSTNTMDEYSSNQLTIDTVIEAPVISINGNTDSGKAYKDDVVPTVSFQDKNYEAYEIMLTSTNYGQKNVDVTDKFVGQNITENANGGSGTLDTFEKIADNDGIYTMTVKMTDKAGHSTETTVVFTVNRFGSVYEYEDYLVSMIAAGGAYVQNIEKDLVLTEYNADKLVAESLVIDITRDGVPVDNVIYEMSQEINDQVQIGESGWYQYKYTISKDNFTKDGIYKISVSSKDATGNAPDIGNYEDKVIVFKVDSTSPEITSVVGLEKAIVDATELTVKYTVFDTIGLKSIQVKVDGKLYGEAITDFGNDLNNYTGSFVIKENSSPQTVQIIVEDLAGNITDTADENFDSAYDFNNAVTVSTNMFVRWYANPLLFWGSIIGVVVVVAGIVALVVFKKKK